MDEGYRNKVVTLKVRPCMYTPHSSVSYYELKVGHNIQISSATDFPGGPLGIQQGTNCMLGNVYGKYPHVENKNNMEN